jgi:6-pyruvoyltetrahydropterin/6-carboxytetrahydropterin synthase
MQAKLTKQFDFAAAHHLPNVPPGHKCGRVHGHNYFVDIVVKGEVDPKMGWVMDYGLIKEICKPIVDSLDHRNLNEIEGLENPTAETLSQWLWAKIKPQLPLLSAVIVRETCQTSCEYNGL